jgi:signal transduction histidine kinase
MCEARRIEDSAMTQRLDRDRHVADSQEPSNQLLLSASRYALAIVATLAAFAATYALRSAYPAPVFLFFVAAIASTAWYGGRGPSVLATSLAVLVSKYAFKEPVGSLRVSRLEDMLPYVVFVAVAAMIILTIEALLRARGLAESRAGELEQVNEDLRHALVSRRLLAAQETERRRIARVLHEDVGQLLTALRLNLQRTPPDRGDRAIIGDSIGLVDEALKYVRDLSVELRPVVLDDLGLADAVSWYANRQAERAGYDVVVDQDLGERRLPEPIETAGFRIVQQALTNIARHADAKHVRIGLYREPGRVELSVADDGIGFDVRDARSRSQSGGSLGLVDMTELAYMAGGVLTVTSAEGKGSTVRVQFPVDSTV